jgi:hypothetical protein
MSGPTTEHVHIAPARAAKSEEPPRAQAPDEDAEDDALFGPLPERPALAPLVNPQGPRVEQGPLLVAPTTSVPEAVVRRVIRVHFGKFRLCYDKELEKNTQSSAFVTARFRITAQGKTERLRLLGDPIGSDFSECLATTFRNISYPTSTGTTTRVQVSLIFSPN